MSLAQLIYRIATEPAFAAHLQQDLATTLAATGLSLDEREITALRVVLQCPPHWKNLCALAESALAPAPTPEGFEWWGAQFNPNPSSPA